MYSQASVLLLFEAITVPPPQTSKRSHSSGWASHCRKQKTGPQKAILGLHICWLLKHNSCRNPHTEVQYMVYLSSTPHSYGVFDSATTVSWQKLRKTPSPGNLHGRYPQQGCGSVGIP